MVKLSDIIRKNGDLKSQDKPGLLSNALKTKNEKITLPEMKKIYEDSILHLKPIMNLISQGKIIEGSVVVNIAEIIVNQLRRNNDTLLSLINIFAFYGEDEDYLYAHSVNASLLATNLGIALEYGRDELVDLCSSSLLHDVGMLKIPQKILNKPSKLDEGEYNLIKKHPAYGLELLKNIKNLPKSVPEVVYQHHERIDGSGYPEGKKGDEISEYAKIVAITEAYEAITHPRPYRKKKIIPYEGVKMIVQKERQTFEPKMIKVFLNIVTPYPLGSFVLLNNNEIGRVVSIHEDFPLRPIVEIFFNAEGKPPERPTRIDLAKSPVLYIEKAVNENDL